jgi:isopentenyl diphosphate isomerase/L-lactate dehydrogenase-like FMN-dependent dehydrogenase
MRVLVKGLVTGEDAALAVEHGADGIVVSNHSGRADASLRSTIECVPEVVAAVAGRIPVLVDSGFRRGTDLFKALALGATAVGVGRPYVGARRVQSGGVEAVLNILQRELRLAMRRAGTVSVPAIARVRDRGARVASCHVPLASATRTSPLPVNPKPAACYEKVLLFRRRHF